MGNFTFSAFFHSYSNPDHVCGECREDGQIVCCDRVNLTGCSTDCGLRITFSIQPFDSPPRDVPLPNQIKIPSDSITFEEGPIVFNTSPRKPNPYIVQLSTWTVSCRCTAIMYTTDLDSVNIMPTLLCHF